MARWKSALAQPAALATVAAEVGVNVFDDLPRVRASVASSATSVAGSTTSDVMVPLVPSVADCGIHALAKVLAKVSSRKQGDGSVDTDESGKSSASGGTHA